MASDGDQLKIFSNMGTRVLNGIVSNYLRRLNLNDAAAHFERKAKENMAILEQLNSVYAWNQVFLYYSSSSLKEKQVMAMTRIRPETYYEFKFLIKWYLEEMNLDDHAEEFAKSADSTPEDFFNTIKPLMISFNSYRRMQTLKPEISAPKSTFKKELKEKHNSFTIV